MEAENEKLKGELLANSIAGLQKELGGQILKLQADIAGNRGNAKSIGDQLKEVMDITAMLGYVKPGNEPKPTVVQNATDAAISLEIAPPAAGRQAYGTQFCVADGKGPAKFPVGTQKAGPGQ